MKVNHHYTWAALHWNETLIAKVDHAFDLMYFLFLDYRKSGETKTKWLNRKWR